MREAVYPGVCGGVYGVYTGVCTGVCTGCFTAFTALNGQNRPFTALPHRFLLLFYAVLAPLLAPFYAALTPFAPFYVKLTENGAVNNKTCGNSAVSNKTCGNSAVKQEHAVKQESMR